MGRIPLEYDLASDARPDQINDIFNVINNIGAKFGTVQIKMMEEVVEITTFRRDIDYDDFRHPNEVFFSVNIHDDLIRRDFTINAMAYNPITNEFIDDYCGQIHLNNKQLVCIGQATHRFTEDTLRPFRCFRFMSHYGFTLSLDIIQALKTLSNQVPLPSIERIRHEMDRLLTGRFWLSALKFMNECGWLHRIVTTPPSEFNMQLPNDPLFRWAWLLNQSISINGDSLQFSKKDIRWMQHIIDWNFDEIAIRLTIKDIAISSETLIELGYHGPQLGEIQNHLLFMIRSNQLNNQERNIIEHLSNLSIEIQSETQHN